MPTETAKKILDNTIKNFVCIDDEYTLPFQEESNDLTRGIYEAFHLKYKNIKIIKYKPDMTVENVTPYFSNADIVILDWDLENGNIDTTLSLLKNAIRTEHIKYIFIYTHDKQAQVTSGLEKIRQALIFSFKNLYSEDEKIDQLKELMLEHELLAEDDIDGYLKAIESELFDFIFEKKNEQQIENALLEKLIQITDDDDVDKNKMCRILGPAKLNKITSILLKNLRNELVGDLELYTDIDFSIKDLEKDVYVADRKLINIVSKNISPEDLLTTIYEFIESEDDSYFNVLSHEILYRFKESFLTRAKLFANVDNQIIKEYVNFRGDVEDKMSIKELVDGIYNDTFMSVLKNQKLSYLEKAPEFFERLEQIEASDKQEKIKYINALVSIDHTKEHLHSYRHKKSIEFGDIFKVEEIGHTNERYAICITPHCDCAHPNSDQEYKFVFSHEIKDSFNIEGTDFDSDFCSFLPLEDKNIKIISWKPNIEAHENFVKTTSLVMTSVNNVEVDIDAIGLPNRELKLKFIAQQKESFTQRLLNESARHAIRVGVSYLNTKNRAVCSI